MIFVLLSKFGIGSEQSFNESRHFALRPINVMPNCFYICSKPVIFLHGKKYVRKAILSQVDN